MLISPGINTLEIIPIYGDEIAKTNELLNSFSVYTSNNFLVVKTGGMCINWPPYPTLSQKAG